MAKLQGMTMVAFKKHRAWALGVAAMAITGLVHAQSGRSIDEQAEEMLRSGGTPQQQRAAAPAAPAPTRSAPTMNNSPEPNFGSPFDDRFWIGAAGGVTVADDDDLDNGVSAIVTFGKTLYENWSIQVEGQYSNLEVGSVGGSASRSDFERLGVGLTGQFIVPLGRLLIGPTFGASFRQIDFLGSDETGVGIHGGLGAVLKLNTVFDLTMDARYVVDFMEGDGAIDDTGFYGWHGLVGLRAKLGTWPPAPPDGDNDGVPDYRDQCPNTPAGAIVNERGCALDSDGDGVPDYLDRCPNTPANVAVDEFGCPLDQDKDGVSDLIDECPDTPEGTDVDALGCPLDTDQDGVINSKDLCPNTPFGAEVDIHGCPFDTDQDGVPDFRDDCPNTPFGTPVNERGCSLDSDGDGVPDTIDQCPNTYPGLEVNEVGCPVKNQVLVLNNVHFEFDRAVLLPDAKQLLDKVAKSLLDQPELKIEVAGHTDSLGSDSYNQRLSEQRAAAVRQYLISRGVAQNAVYSKGYGERVPVASNQTEDGQALNRRVEIHLLDD